MEPSRNRLSTAFTTASKRRNDKIALTQFCYSSLCLMTPDERQQGTSPAPLRKLDVDRGSPDREEATSTRADSGAGCKRTTAISKTAATWPSFKL